MISIRSFQAKSQSQPCYFALLYEKVLKSNLLLILFSIFAKKYSRYEEDPIVTNPGPFPFKLIL